MSDTARVRWYRHGGNRLAASILISLLGLFPAWLVIFGIGHPPRWTYLVTGTVLAAAIALLACLPLRAGIGVTPDRILVRSSFGDTKAIPWAQVTGFECGKTGPKDKHDEDAIFVLTADGERLHTSGYSPGGSSPTKAWQLLRVLEAERLARTPGAASTLPPAPPAPKPGTVPWSPPLAGLGVLALIVFGAIFMSMGMTEIGPGIQAAHGGGTAGYFIPGQEPSGRTPWYGDFRLPGGTVTRVHAQIADLGNDQLHTGVPVPARDTGDPDFVYPRDDQGAWHGPAIVILGAAWCLGWALIVIIRAGIRWLRRTRHGDDGQVTALPQTTGTAAAPLPNRLDTLAYTVGPDT